MIYAIGAPGQRPRLFMRCNTVEQAELQMQPGEVFVEVADHADVTIAPDGLSVCPRGKPAEELEAEAAEAFAAARRAAYPSIAEQLDQIYHEGLDAWRETIAAAKASVPKPGV